MKFVLTSADRVKLRRAAYLARGATVRRRSQWVLLVASGVTVARLARLAGVSRPTVYRYLRLWIRTGDPAALRSGGSGRRLQELDAADGPGPKPGGRPS